MTEITMKYSVVGMELLTANLGFYDAEIPEALQIYLQSLMEYAFDEFAEMKIRLKPGVLQDDMDQMTYAAWMYRKSVTGEGKTEMLRSIIRNRQVRNALADREGTS